MHTLAGRARFVDPVDGSLFDVNAWYGRLAAQRRLVAWHIKDADRNPMPTPGTNPFTQEHFRPRFGLNSAASTSFTSARARSARATRATSTRRCSASSAGSRASG